MIRHRRITTCFIVFLVIHSACVTMQASDKFFDLPAADDNLVVTILHPYTGAIRSLMILQESGLFPSEGITVVGVYLDQQMTDYSKAKDLVEGERLDWFRFHRIDSELDKESLFTRNACTAEFQKIFRRSDGILFYGGADIPPELYGRKTNLLTGIQTPFRHYLELSFLFHLVGGYQDESYEGFLESDPEFPILCFCLGSQTLNVAAGGTLVQDIWSETYRLKYVEDVLALDRDKWHSNPLTKVHPEYRSIHLFPYSYHEIKLSSEGKFCTVLQWSPSETPTVLSAHHQAVDDLGKNIRVVATSLDGRVVEAVEHTEYANVLGTQFHPEFEMLWDDSQTFILTPDEEPRSLPALLESDPPSRDFHRSIWTWFSDRLNERK